MDEIVNKIEKSGLVIIDLEEFYPKQERCFFDIKYLFEEIILKEKDFRHKLSLHDWTIYQDSYVSIGCSKDVIVPFWAYLLVGSYLFGIAKGVFYGSLDELEKYIFNDIICSIDIEKYRDKKVLIKGCSKRYIPENSYILLISRLQLVVSSIMFGEPCGAVPLYKRKKD